MAQELDGIVENNRNIAGRDTNKNRNEQKRKILIEIELDQNIVKCQLEKFLGGAFKVSASSEQNVKEGPEISVPAAFYFRRTFHE